MPPPTLDYRTPPPRHRHTREERFLGCILTGLFSLLVGVPLLLILISGVGLVVSCVIALIERPNLLVLPGFAGGLLLTAVGAAGFWWVLNLLRRRWREGWGPGKGAGA